jgi:hypothetical protein
MRVTIVPADGFVSVDGEGYSGLDLSFIPVQIHAVQWYGTSGEIEHQDSRGRAVSNQEISDIDAFRQALDAWILAKEAATQLYLKNKTHQNELNKNVIIQP